MKSNSGSPRLLRDRHPHTTNKEEKYPQLTLWIYISDEGATPALRSKDTTLCVISPFQGSKKYCLNAAYPTG